MIRKFVYNKIFRTSGMLLLFILLVIFPVSKEYGLEDNNTMKTSYDNNKETVYLIDKDNYVARSSVRISFYDNLDKAKKIVQLLIIDGPYEDKIPNGFRAILSSDTKINDIKINGDAIILDIDTDFSELNNEDDLRAIEALTYNMTSIPEINNLYININGKALDYLSSSGIFLKGPFTKKDGVNKKYDLYNYKDTKTTTVYYVGKSNKDFYYIPVTKVSNDNREKIKIIVDELTSSHIYETNLISFLNYNTKLLDYEIFDNSITLDFNDYIFDDVSTKNILEEVIYSISLSVIDNYNIKEVIYKVNGVEITKSTIKDIE